MMIDGYILGFIATASLVAAMFFVRFWWRTRDFLFLAFATAFVFQAIASTATIFTGDPTGVKPSMYILQICTYLLILAAILLKNRRAR
jgi:hypothetical protein